jgi:RNA:NAD 2'-phosphotransferase (TPT1/KptA family)
VDLDHERLLLHSDERVTYSKFISVSLIAFCSQLTILVRQWGLRAKNDLVLVLDAKGAEIKAKAINGSATT